jgi:VanZ family protein
MGVIFSASTDLGNVNHSSRFFIPAMKWLFPHISDSTLDLAHRAVRKAGHLSEFAVLGILMLRAIRSVPALMSRRTGKGMVLLAILLCALYACTDETHQLFVSSREGCVTDVMIDTFGASMGILFYAGLLRWFKRR